MSRRLGWIASGAVVVAALVGVGCDAAVNGPSAAAVAGAKASGCVGDNGGITLPPGFCATVFADGLGHVRHVSVAPSGVVYANSTGGRGGAPDGGWLIALRDSDGDGKADVTTRFGETAADGSKGGTGVMVRKGYVYAEVNDRIVRYPLVAASGGGIAPTGKPETMVSGLPLNGDHPMHPFFIDAKGGLYVDVASATNSCQPKNRMPGVKGADPCVELETRAGIWRYDADKPGQVFSAKARYATGIRNGEGIAADAAGRLYATQHGRDQLAMNWAALYPDAKAAADLPAEELVGLVQGGDYGWPTCYYDGAQKKLVLAPEYGGDGGKAVGPCAGKRAPVAAFPGHWAPNALMIYSGTALPAAWRGGAFIAFHGSWNRAPEPQGGFNVVFQPLRDGKAAGPWVVFADGFAGPGKAVGKADYRPTGLAQGPDGAIYISDDNKGRIWRVTYRGPLKGAVSGAAAPEAVKPAAAAPAVAAGGLPVPAGSSAAQVALGERVFKTKATCAGCHGPDAKGSPVGPDLTSGTWLWGDGSLGTIHETIAKGVQQPKKFQAPMPPMGGSQLSADELSAVSAYVWAVGHKGKP